MGIDYSYPNEDTAVKMGLFDQYDAGTIPGHPGTHSAGWAKSIIDKMTRDEEAKQPSNPNQSNPWKSTDYPQDEQDVWNWYENEVIPIDKWKALVQDYKNNGGKNIKVDPYNGNTDHTFPNPSGTITTPDVSAYKGGSDNTNGDLKVSTDAIKYFANQIEKVASEDGTGVLMDSAKKFDGLNVRPGKFYKAEVMRQAVAGSGAPGAGPGLVGDTQGLMKHLHSTLVSLKEDLLTLATTYDKAEEFNHLTAQGLAKDMDKSWGNISGIDQFGNFGEGS